MRHTLFALAMIAGAGLAGAGEVEVAFVDPDRYTDAGYGVAAQQTQKTLSEHLVKLGTTVLPARRSLAIEVLDIDLAGATRYGWRRSGPDDPRVLLGKADRPQITLRYTLRDSGQMIGQGEDRVTDLGYLGNGLQVDPHKLEPLVYEKRMLSEWFSERFAAKP